MISLGQVSAILAIVAIIPYIYEIFWHGVKPERASWFVWTILLAINYIGQRGVGAQDSLWLTAGDILGTFIIFVLSIFRGVGGFTRFDLQCLGIAFIGVLLWQLSGNPTVALLGTLLADAMGELPTLRKAYRDPASEGWTAFAIITVASLIAIKAARTTAVEVLLVPIYLAVANFAVIVARYLGFKKQENA